MTLLLLAGSGQARVIAEALDQLSTIASLAGATRTPRQLSVPTRHGGFGGEEGFLRFLKDNKITAVLDATHPFANHISHRTARLCKSRGLPFCQYLRPKWSPETGDIWHDIEDETEVAALATKGDTIFLATGRQTLYRYENLSHCRLICRQIDPPESDFPFPNGAFLVGRPPFSIDDEIALFRRLNVDWLVVKNAGGEAPRSKLNAARVLGLPVIMIKRPQQPDCMRVTTVQDAIKWARCQEIHAT